ncbi:hypothetical protein [Gordonia sp. OPL2]|nr:hypothetical protein [Gordonia sp. OPL2]
MASTVIGRRHRRVVERLLELMDLWLRMVSSPHGDHHPAAAAAPGRRA